MSSCVYSSCTSGPTTLWGSSPKDFGRRSIRRTSAEMSLRSYQSRSRAQRRCASAVCAAGLAVGVMFWTASTLAQESGAAPPLSLEFKIPLGHVAGRIDHMAVDLARRRLFVAELG